LRFRLYILKDNYAMDYSEKRRLRIAVVSLDKAKTYPLNFVCTLPLRLSSNEAKLTTFERRFGDKSGEVAKKLLTDALKTEEDEDVRDEIERRLSLLQPESTIAKTCASCGKTFQVNKKKRFRQRFCEECLRKKFGAR
jgi:hypothetical protein